MRITVLMSVYDQERPEYLDECLQSLLRQTKRAEKVVLVEDGSIPAGLKAVIERYREPLHITSVTLERNQGLAVALNEGLKHCDDELIARMDSDDIAYPQRFERQSAFMAEHPGISVSSAYLEEVDEMDNLLGYRILPLDDRDIRQFARKRNPISHPCTVFRRKDVLDAGGYPLLKKSQDYALWSAMMVRGYRFGNIGEVLLRMRTGAMFYRRRGGDYLKHELELLRFQHDIGFLNPIEHGINLVSRSVLRLSPVWFKDILYRRFR